MNNFIIPELQTYYFKDYRGPNCSGPGTALLGPVFTGATTKSAARASLSFTSNQIVKNIKVVSKKSKKEVTEIVKKVNSFDYKLKKKSLIHFHN